jgi:tRNA U55 pseudouridine synthase TruB
VDPGTQKLQTTPDPLPLPVTVTTSRLEIVNVEADTVTLRIDCSAGFYVRSLAHDLGARLGTGGHLTALRRTRSGAFTLTRAITLDAAERDPALVAASIVPMAAMLPDVPQVKLTDEGLRLVMHGRSVGPGDWLPAEPLVAKPRESQIPNPESLVCLLDQRGNLVALARSTGAAGVLHPSIVLV